MAMTPPPRPVGSPSIDPELPHPHESTGARNRIQSEVESFTTRLTEHLSTRLVPWERRRDACLQSKKALALESKQLCMRSY